MRIERDEMFMDIAHTMSRRSTCLRGSVGAILVKDKRIIATGYNGVVSGASHCTVCEGPGCHKSIHAEAGLIAYCAKNGIATNGTTLYVTLSPCEKCAQLIINAGIAKVIYNVEYRDPSGVYKLQRNNVEVEKYEKL